MGFCISKKVREKAHEKGKILTVWRLTTFLIKYIAQRSIDSLLILT